MTPPPFPQQAWFHAHTLKCSTRDITLSWLRSVRGPEKQTPYTAMDRQRMEALRGILTPIDMRYEGSGMMDANGCPVMLRITL